MSQQSERTRIRNHPERAVPDESAEILAQGQVAHVGFVADGQPFVVPLTYIMTHERRTSSTCTALFAAGPSIDWPAASPFA